MPDTKIPISHTLETSKPRAFPAARHLSTTIDLAIDLGLGGAALCLPMTPKAESLFSTCNGHALKILGSWFVEPTYVEVLIRRALNHGLRVRLDGKLLEPLQ